MNTNQQAGTTEPDLPVLALQAGNVSETTTEASTRGLAPVWALT